MACDPLSEVSERGSHPHRLQEQGGREEWRRIVSLSISVLPRGQAERTEI